MEKNEEFVPCYKQQSPGKLGRTIQDCTYEGDCIIKELHRYKTEKGTNLTLSDVGKIGRDYIKCEKFCYENGTATVHAEILSRCKKRETSCIMAYMFLKEAQISNFHSVAQTIGEEGERFDLPCCNGRE